MKKCLLIAILFYAISFQLLFAQEVAPLLTGTVNISVTKGTMECDFKLKDMPPINNNYVIRINSGMNIHYFRNVESNINIYYDTDTKDTLSSGESIAYFFPDNHNKGRFLPQELELKYVGMYPVADSVRGYMVQDWKGNVAFNGYSVRADGYQSAWYPVLYDNKKNQLYDKVRYDINITCDDCTTLFVNGSKPVTAKSANFKSDKPNELAIYCGKFDVADVNGTWILNPDMNREQQQEFLNIVNSYKRYYEQNLGIKYTDDITFIQTTNTAPPDHAFLFVSYPAIMNIGTRQYGLKTMFDKKRGDYYKPYIAHELAHYYFGHYLEPNSGFSGVISESFAEYLSFKVTKSLFADSVYQNIINKKLKALEKFQPVPLSSIKYNGDIKDREFYVYYYAPIIFTAIEKEIGEKKMWQWMRNMLNTKTELTDYDFFEKTFNLAVNDKAKSNAIKAKYFSSPDALDSAIATIKAGK